MFVEKILEGMKYLLRFPEDAADGKAYPVLILMHGAGTRSENLDKLKENPFFPITAKHKDFPFVVAAPLCSKDTWFDLFETLNSFAKYISSQSFADPERIYLVGASMGGYAVWQMAMSNPGLYAAIVPICGGGMYWNAPRLADLPVWAFHGDIDSVVKTEESQKMVDKINAAGGNAKLTIYENCGHDAWSETYGNWEVFGWLLSHRRRGAAAQSTEFQDSKIYG